MRVGGSKLDLTLDFAQRVCGLRVALFGCEEEESERLVSVGGDAAAGAEHDSEVVGGVGESAVGGFSEVARGERPVGLWRGRCAVEVADAEFELRLGVTLARRGLPPNTSQSIDKEFRALNSNKRESGL